MSFQSYPSRLLAKPSAVRRGGIEVIDTVSDSIINQLIHALLVDNFTFRPRHKRPTHTAIAQQGYLISTLRVKPISHTLISFSLFSSSRFSFVCTGTQDTSCGKASATESFQEFSSIYILIHKGFR